MYRAPFVIYLFAIGVAKLNQRVHEREREEKDAN